MPAMQFHHMIFFHSIVKRNYLIKKILNGLLNQLWGVGGGGGGGGGWPFVISLMIDSNHIF